MAMRRFSGSMAARLALAGVLAGLAGWVGPCHAAAQAPTPATPDSAPAPSSGDEWQEQAEQAFGEAMALFERQKFQDALDKLHQALDLFRRAGDRESEAITLAYIGRVSDDLGRYDDALRYYEQALAVARELDLLFFQGVLLGNLGAVYQALGQYDEALDYHTRALTIARQLGERELESTVLTNVGQVHKELAQYDLALDYYDQSLALAREDGDRSTEATVVNNVAGVYYARGQYAQAAAFYQDSLAILRETGDRANEGLTLGNLALVNLALGEYSQALPALHQSLDIAREIGNRPGESAALDNLGQVYFWLGQFSRAAESLSQALEIVRQTGEAAREGVILNNLAVVFDNQGRLGEAQRAYAQALDIARNTRNLRGEAAILGNLGLVLDAQGQPEQAVEMHRRALAIQRDIGDVAGQALSYNNLGTIHLAAGRVDQAWEALQEALRIEEVLGDRVLRSRTLLHIGRILERRGRLEEALNAYRSAIAVHEAIRAAAGIEEMRAGVAARAQEPYQHAASLLMRLGRPAQAFQISERARARAFLDQLGNARIDASRDADAELVRREQAARQEVAALDRSLRQERAQPAGERNASRDRALAVQLAAARRAYEDALDRIRLANPEYASLVSVSPLTLTETQRLLDADTTLVSYFTVVSRTLAFVVTRDAFHALELPIAEEEVLRDIRAFLDDPGLGEPAPPLERLHRALVAPLLPYLRTPVVGLIPNGALNYLPFATLRDGPRYLGDQFTLFHLPSASALPFIQAKRKPDDEPDSLLALAYDQPPGLPPLVHARREALAIAELFGGRAVVGAAASEQVFDTLAGGQRLVHLAAHGQLNTANPLFSRVVLAAAGESDGALEVHEVYGLSLDATDLVVLSACQTQLGARSRGDDVVGLSRAFLYAGAPTVIASLWNVDDEATEMLMTSFYRHLKEGQGKAQALRSAQAETRAQYPHPFYWAAFVLTGDPGVRSASATPPTPASTTATTGIGAPEWALLLAAGLIGLLAALIGAWLWRRRM